ncbi:putative homogentisate phytyltransferase 1, chloroplastic [Apostasia shenzhenica]|uniref:Putative homogentisate phytyltransferase 1, chloroplastic n=1 Tax=Apostasia shenzhenica TaxID=1088818 RepID=A0A2I0B6P4_9ASPA|nr:putative homogentisate phytyltransferase 1, chloroplastic [Apostasia shenzhenica]
MPLPHIVDRSSPHVFADRRQLLAISLPACSACPAAIQRKSDTIDNFSTTNLVKSGYWSVTNDNSCKWRQKNAESEYSEPLDDQNQHWLNVVSQKLLPALRTFYAFTRPYAFIGIIVAVVSSSLIAIESFSDASLPFIIGLFQALVGFMTICVYSNGINQVFDVGIDKVNKPYLPLASGEMPFKVGVAIVCAFAVMAFGIANFAGSKPLFWGIVIFAMATSAYSINIFAFHRHGYFSRPLVFGVIVLVIFYTVLALFKDIPDIEGDKQYGVKSLATSIGQKKIFSHVALASILWTQAKSVDLKNKTAISSFYMFLWKVLHVFDVRFKINLRANCVDVLKGLVGLLDDEVPASTCPRNRPRVMASAFLTSPTVPMMNTYRNGELCPSRTRI